MTMMWLLSFWEATVVLYIIITSRISKKIFTVKKRHTWALCPLFFVCFISCCCCGGCGGGRLEKCKKYCK